MERTRYIPLTEKCVANIKYAGLRNFRVLIEQNTTGEIVDLPNGEAKVLCCFHNDKNPSLSINFEKGIYKCWSCGATGDYITFVIEKGLAANEDGQNNYVKALHYLAKINNIPLEYNDVAYNKKYNETQTLKSKLFEVNAIATTYYQQQLKSNKPQQYLQERGISQEAVTKFSLGYASNAWTTLLDYLKNKYTSLDDNLIRQSGLFIYNDKSKNYYDRFRDRLIFPIKNTRGQVIGFGGRTLSSEDSRKYINSPKTPLFNKGEVLYNLGEAKPHIKKSKSVIVVEGYMDVISLSMNGYENTVATMGTAVNTESLKELSSTAEKIYLNLDSDDAGVNAIDKLLPAAARLKDTETRIVQLPSPIKDADEFFKSHPPEKYQEILDNAPKWLIWKTKNIIKSCSDEKKCIDEAFKYLSMMGEPELGLYISTVAQILARGDVARSSDIRNYLQGLAIEQGNLKRNYFSRKIAPKKSKQQVKPPVRQNGLEKNEKLLLQIYVHFPDHRYSIIHTLNTFNVFFRTKYIHKAWLEFNKAIADDSNYDAVNFYNNHPEFSDFQLIDNDDTVSNTIEICVLDMHISYLDAQCKSLRNEDKWVKLGFTNEERVQLSIDYYNKMRFAQNSRNELIGQLTKMSSNDLIGTSV